MLGRRPVVLLCDCGWPLDRWQLDEKRGQLRPTKRGKVRSDAPIRAGHPQVLGYRCSTRTCRRDVVLSFAELERAVVRALRRGKSHLQVGVDVLGRSRGEQVRTTTVTAKAPIPGGYRRPWVDDETD